LIDIDTRHQPVFINYLDIKAPTSERKSALAEQYYFECQCQRCSTDGDFIDFKACRDLDKRLDDLIEEGLWVEAYRVGLKSLPLYEKIYGEYHPDFTVQLLRILKIKLVLSENESEHGSELASNSDSVIFFVNKAKAALEVTHGSDHALYKLFLHLLY
jgi:hypothetical protein